MQSFGNEFVLFVSNWLWTVECWQLFWAGITDLARKKKKKNTYSRVFKNAAIEKPNVGAFSHILNAAQSGSIDAFFTKCSYKSLPIGGGKMQL